MGTQTDISSATGHHTRIVSLHFDKLLCLAILGNFTCGQSPMPFFVYSFGIQSGRPYRSGMYGSSLSSVSSSKSCRGSYTTLASNVLKETSRQRSGISWAMKLRRHCREGVKPHIPNTQPRHHLSQLANSVPIPLDRSVHTIPVVACTRLKRICNELWTTSFEVEFC